MWINESVFCAAYTYKWGIALPIWWASGLSFQIALMAVLGIVAKLRVPYAHTSLEFMRMRYGAYVHWLFILLNLVNNVFVSRPKSRPCRQGMSLVLRFV